ncbi:restriction endonuclease subunit S [Empedobacter falsenii]|uniref:restriction endonuclease subunit S n=1 Tax=Empedobacter falsenii TaxID=343874 RepID=UPI003A7FFB1E
MSYKKLGDLVRFISNKNTDERATVLYGINIDKFFMPSVANTIGVDLKKYKVVDKYQFACNRMHVGRDKRLPISMSTYDYPFIVSPAYDVFEVIDTNVVIPEYLMLWFRRGEFDRQCWFYTDADVRGGLHLDALKAIEIEILSIEKQREIVAQYEAVANKIRVNEAICEKLEATAQALYKQWFVDFEFPITKESHPELFCHSELVEESTTKSYKSSGGKMIFNEELEREIPEGWDISPVSEYFKVNSGFAFKSDWWTNSGVPIIKIGTIKNNTIEESELAYINENKLSKSIKAYVEQGDIVIAMTGFTMGKIGLIPNIGKKIYVNQRVGYYKTGNTEMDSVGYLYCILKTQEFQNQIWSFGGDSQQFNVSNNQVDSINILQSNDQELINQFNTITAPIFKRLNFSYNINQKLSELQSLLLSRLARLEG